MTERPLGRLERVDLRKAWEIEALQFTPWLAKPENLVLLGETLGINLEPVEQESSVGPFRADILCKVSGTDSWVLIENQLEKTDHIHLGQLLTYAAGLKAVSIVWIAAKFTDEHRAALDWLNEITDAKFSFFGLEIEVWRIGDSPLAPKFNVVCQPNDWTRFVHEAGEMSETKSLQLAFWTAFRDYLQDGGGTVPCGKPAAQHWFTHPLGKSGRPGSSLLSIAGTWDYDINSGPGVIRVEVNLYDTRAKNYFDQLFAEKDSIEGELGYPLQWYTTEGVMTRRIYVRQTADIKNRDLWPEQHAWLKQHVEDFLRVFGHRIRALRSPDSEEVASSALEGSASFEV